MRILPPFDLKLTEILPSKPVLLMGAGPVPVPKEVAAANSIIISHLGDTMKMVVSRIQTMAQYVFQTKSQKIFGIAGPSSAAMEMAVTSLLWPGRKALVLNLGTFSGRFAELARGVGADVTELYPEGMAPFRVGDIRKALESNHYDVLTLVQGETSCGIKNVELEQIVSLAHQYNVRVIVDAVCTLSTMELPMDAWGIDVVVVGGQKGLSAIAGISMIAFSEETFEFISKRQVTMPHWCLDPRRAYRFWGQGEYHYTAPVSGLLALHEGLRLICLETLEKRFARHLTCSILLQECLEILGLELFTPKEHRLNSVVAIKNPLGVNSKDLIKHIVKTYHVEISGAFGLDIIRIGQMGEQCRPENIQSVLRAVGEGYSSFGVKLDVEGALSHFTQHQEKMAALSLFDAPKVEA